MRSPGWYFLTTSPEGRSHESDGFKCQHCQKVVMVKPMCDPADMGGRCYVCDNLICPACVGKGCDVVEEKLKRAEAQSDARRSYEQCS